MKSTSEKVAFAIAIVIIIAVISAIIGGIVLITKLINYTKDSITPEKFAIIMEEKGFTVIEDKDKFVSPYITVDKKYTAKKDGYEIEFYTFKDVDDAEEFFSQTKAKFESNDSNVKVDFTGKNYAVFNIETNGRYKFVERIDKTVLCLNINKQHKDTVDDIVKDLGY
ncbi:MAG: hypothetical protein K6B70_06040 [Clostridia bacterium]|nr:hypothetical protein [Clostridia bacterium]